MRRWDPESATSPEMRRELLGQTRRRAATWVLAAAFGVVSTACGGDLDVKSSPEVRPDDPFALAQPDALATPCTFDAASGLMTVTVAGGETALLSRRATDSVITQNGDACNVPARATSVKALSIRCDSGDSTVIVSFANGVFATGSVTSTLNRMITGNFTFP